MYITLLRKLILWSVVIAVVPRLIAEFVHHGAPSAFDSASPTLITLAVVMAIVCIVATIAFYRLVAWGRTLASASTIASIALTVYMPSDTSSSLIAATDYLSTLLWGAAFAIAYCVPEVSARFSSIATTGPMASITDA